MQRPQEKEDRNESKKFALAQQTLAELARKPKLDNRKLGGLAETLDPLLKGLSLKPRSLHPIVIYNGEPDSFPSIKRWPSMFENLRVFPETVRDHPETGPETVVKYAETQRP